MSVLALGQQAYRRATSRRGLLLAGAGVLTVLLAGLVWITVTALVAHGRLERAEAQLPRLKAAIGSGDLADARSITQSIAAEASSAHALVSGPAWWVGANLPVVGAPLSTTRAVADASDRLGSTALPALITLTESVRQAKLRLAHLSMPALTRVAADLARADAGLHAATAALSGTPRTSWLPVADHGRDSLSGLLTPLGREVSEADDAMATALPMLGEYGPRRYFVGFMDEAESRGLGGIPGAFAILTADHGKIEFTHFGNDDELAGVRAPIRLGAGFTAQYGSSDPTGVFQNSDISPDFRDAAQIWAGMWQAKTGQHIDGAIALDPTALSYLLQVSGGASLPAGTPGAEGGTPVRIDAGDVVALAEQQQYSLFESTPQLRKRFVLALADAVAGAVTTEQGSPSDLLAAVQRAVGERRLVIWSAHPAEERAIIAHGFGGTLPGSGVTTGFTVVNGAATKLDYYLDRRMSYDRCSGSGTARVRLTLHNAAPASGLPSYVTTRFDHPGHPTRPGDNFLIVTYYATPGATVTAATLDGTPVAVATGTERGLVTVRLGVELPRGATRTLTLSVHEPSSGPVHVLRQPLVRPLTVRLGTAC